MHARLEVTLAQRVQAALEMHLLFWPFELGAVVSHHPSFDVSALHPQVVASFEIDTVGCNPEAGRTLLEFAAVGGLRNTMLASALRPCFFAHVEELDGSHALALGGRIALPSITIARRLEIVA